MAINSSHSSRLVLLRNALNINQNRFAKSVKLSQSYISFIERGTPGMSQSLITAIVTTYPQVNAAWLLTGEG